MYEVELKVRADHDRVRAALTDRGAVHEATVEQEDTYYDAPDREFAETDEALRIRRERENGTTRTLLTYKGPLVEAESKTREEAETAVEDGHALEAILDGLGYTPAATVSKERELFSFREFTVTLDTVEGLGEFVEVETEVESGVDRAREGAREVMRTLGLDPTEQIRSSYLGLLLSKDAPE